MQKTNTIFLSGCPDQKIKIFINEELFIDQNIPYTNTKLTLNYNSNLDEDNICISNGTIFKIYSVSSNDTVNIDMNK